MHVLYYIQQIIVTLSLVIIWVKDIHDSELDDKIYYNVYNIYSATE